VSVTAVLSRTADPLAPLLVTLARMDLASNQPALTGLARGVRLPGHRPGWVSSARLVDGERLTELLDAAARRWRGSPHASAALAWKCYSYWTSLPAVLSYAVARRVPLMTPDAVAVRWSTHQPFLTAGMTQVRVAVLASDPLAVSPTPEIVVVPDEEALRAVLRSSVIEAHLAPLLDRIREHVHVGPRTLWGSLASGVAHGLSRAADALPGPTMDVAQDLLRLFDVDDLVSLSPAPTGAGLCVQRRTCCLAFTLPEPKVCAGCVIRHS
jgi:ferric iron reductase protein FhuF